MIITIAAAAMGMIAGFFAGARASKTKEVEIKCGTCGHGLEHHEIACLLPPALPENQKQIH